MNPQNDDQQRDMPSAPERDHSLNTHRHAAANVIRDDIDRIFEDGGSPTKAAEDSLKREAAQAYQQTHKPHTHTASTADRSAIEAEWQQYHSSWQSYYQQYYERYYLQQLSAQQADTPQTTTQPQSHAQVTEEDTNQKVHELREKLVKTVQDQAKTVRKSHHFAPIATAVVCALLFLFLQYNRFLVATVQAYISPGSINPQNVIVEEGANTPVGPEPKLIIPKINVDAPIIFGVNVADNTAVEDQLRNGVVHYPISSASSQPGQKGATVILGHSSNDVFDNGQYKFIFVQLSKLEVGDNFSINFNGVRYIYSVTSKEIIDPKEVSKVTADPSKPSVILITCDPPGTALKRLLVFAEQVTPNPEKATQPEKTKQTQSQDTSIIGNGSTFLERLFGVR